MSKKPNKANTTSLIIPTLDRTHDLRRCLTSICQLNQQFDEIIIIEQGDVHKTKEMIAQFDGLNIWVYFHPTKSLTQARNLGLKQVRGEFIFFIDDDTELDQDYLKVGLDYFEQHPKVMGITGPLSQDMCIFDRSWKLKIYQTLFLLNGHSFNISRSGYYQNNWGKVKNQAVQWLAGCSMAYRRQVFTQGFNFNENFIAWSSGEDIMFSYQIYKFYGKGALMYVPEFYLQHHENEKHNLTQTNLLKMRIIYHFIFWKKEVHQGSFFNFICYLHSQIGLFLFELYPKRRMLTTLKTLLKSYGYLLRHHRKIHNNQIDYNQFILSNH